jgi:hypothetical protein
MTCIIKPWVVVPKLQMHVCYLNGNCQYDMVPLVTYEL